MELNDELLSAYLDNALDEERQAAVSAALATDAGARLRLERMQAAYAHAIAEEYRFYSYGDSSLLIP